MRRTFMTGLASVLAFMALASMGAMGRGSEDFTPRDPAAKQAGHWEWAWDGGDALGISVPATVRVQRGGPPRIVITGPDALLEKLEVGQGRIRFCRNCTTGPGQFEITVSGVGLRKAAIEGADIDIQFGRLDQDVLYLAVAGTGQISAEGHVDDVKVSIVGAGNVHLEKVTARRADINIAGSGDIGLTPSQEANIRVAGSGHVWMTAPPRRLVQAITGSGGMRIARN